MKPFLSDRPRVTAPILLHPHAADTAALGIVLNGAKSRAHGAGTADGAEPSRVECIRQGDKITRLVITCACGERIELDCLYAGG